ncbi:MAG: hypothetical protein C4525_14520 [Desulfarculus sp.]|jgi:hypothetical protein|nr:MAG: hypothetical protein C4525_14520 [Desulfarculus sp.]
MPSVSLFWKVVDTLDPDPQQAQIVIGLDLETGRGGKLLDLGSLLADELGCRLRGSGQTEAVLVVSTSSRAHLETVLRLVKLGVNQLHAIYPHASKNPGGPANPVRDESTNVKGN